MECLRKILRSKIHRARVTHADVNYEGSITLPPELLKAADILEYEAVQIWNVTNGNRFETYAMIGQKGSGEVCVNGAAAHLAKPGDIIIIACFSNLPESTVSKYKPKIIFVNEQNYQITSREEIPGPLKLTS